MMKFETMQFQLGSAVLLLLPSWLHKLNIHFSETESQLWVKIQVLEITHKIILALEHKLKGN